MYDIIIIGAGPAGLTAALYALRANKKVLVIESKVYGGQIINAGKIENYPGIQTISGPEFAMILYNQVEKLGLELKIETVIRIDNEKNVITNKNEYKAKKIIIATGAKKKRLNIENEEKYIGKGISYCATCDGNFYKDKEVAIVGKDNSMFEDALFLADLAKKVYIIYQGDKIEGKYFNELNVKNNIEILTNSEVVKINGNEVLSSIEIQENHERINEIEVQGLFINVGQEPQNEIFANVIDLDENGYIKSNDGVHTNVDGIYVAGDARQKELRQLTTAVGDGSVAAITAIKEINEGGI